MDSKSLWMILRSDVSLQTWLKELLCTKTDSNEFLIIVSKYRDQICHNVVGMNLNDDIIPGIWISFFPVNLSCSFVKRGLRIRNGEVVEKSRLLGITLSVEDLNDLKHGHLISQVNGNWVEYTMKVTRMQIKSLVEA